MPKYNFERNIVDKLSSAMKNEKPLIRIIIGPRQVGKTTAAIQIADKWDGPIVNASADQPLPPGPEWIENFWEIALLKKHKNTLLILDEIQKVNGWSEVVKALWDIESQKENCLHVLLLGSSSLLIQKGLTESLAGRFFLYRCSHWSYTEVSKAFSMDLDNWIFFGGYPGTYSFIGDENVWSQYVRDSLIETVLAKDVLQFQNISKPALLRHLFMLSASHPAQILSYTKMLGQLNDAGNTTTLAHYVKVLESAYLLSGLELYRKGIHSKKGSSPKLLLWNNALISSITGLKYKTARHDHNWWGHLVENAVGAHIVNSLTGMPYFVYYWRQRDCEVDFIIETPTNTWAIEVKSTKTKRTTGLKRFCTLYPDAKPLIIGGNGMRLEEFFMSDLTELF